jgi:hypothetical protein
VRRVGIHRTDFTVGTDSEVMASERDGLRSPRDEARFGHLHAVGGVARGLLQYAAMSLAFGTLGGCIVPVPLERQPTQADSPPEIVTSLAKPAEYSLVEIQTSDSVEFSFPVDDADLEDTLNARLFREDNGTKIDEDDNLFADQSNPARRTAMFTNTYCLLFNLTGNATVPIFAIVTDRPFPDGDTEKVTGESASISWILKCD